MQQRAHRTTASASTDAHSAAYLKIWDVHRIAGGVSLAAAVLVATVYTLVGDRSGGPEQAVVYAESVVLALAALYALLTHHATSGLLSLAVVVDGIFVAAALLATPSLFALCLAGLFPLATAIAWQCSSRIAWSHAVAVMMVIAATLIPARVDATTITVGVVALVGYAGSVGTVQWISTRLRELVKQVARDAVTDQLTDLPNRRFLEYSLTRGWQPAPRRDYVVAIVLDLDHFKLINDTYGHATGDAVLRQAAAAISRQLSPQDLVIRSGGEEILVLTGARYPLDAYERAEVLRASVSRDITDGQVTASVGVAVATRDVLRDSENVWRLIDAADRAMYDAKQRGRDCTVLSEQTWLNDSGTRPFGGAPSSRGPRFTTLSQRTRVPGR